MSEPRVLATGLGFTEGPVWTVDGRLLVTSISRGMVSEVALDGSGVVRQVEVGGGPNGLAEDDRGRFWVAQNGGALMDTRSSRPVSPGLQEIADADVRDVHGAFHSPNDLVLGPDGRIWFTDPDPEEGKPGRVHAHDRSTGETTCVADGLVDFPNGLAFSRDGTVLYVGETRTGHVHRYAVHGGELEYQGIFATLPEGGPDGMAFDADGDLWAAAPRADALFALSPDGTPRAPLRFAAPAFPTNLCFAGPDADVLVVTAVKGGAVLAFDGVARGFGSLVGPS